MNAERYIHKAILQLQYGKNKEAVESLNLILSMKVELQLLAQAHCILGEYYFHTKEYEEAAPHLEWMRDHSAYIREMYDDLLEEEINCSNTLLHKIKNS